MVPGVTEVRLLKKQGGLANFLTSQNKCMQVFARGKAIVISMARPKLTRSISLKNVVSPQVGRIMKLTAILIFAACLHVSAKGVAQNVNLSEKDAPLQKVIKEIEKQTDYVFFYKSVLLLDAKKVTITAVNMPLQQVLDICFKNQPFGYYISGKNITIGPKTEEKKIEKNPIDVSGKITDKDGNPLAGANIKIKGTNKGATTNSDGSFTLKDVEDNSVLEVSYVGFETQIIPIQGKRFFAVNLNPKNSLLDETIVLAYGSTTTRFNTGNISKVKASEIDKQPVNNPLLALEGRIPGVFVTQTSGFSGTGIVVRVQGQNSLQNGSNPLYVVDGVPISTEVPAPLGYNLAPYPNSGESYIRQTYTGRGNTLSFLNPSDIESIEVLKDADATAIYGSRAANGAILITTKKGKSGKITVNAGVRHGLGEVGHFMKLLNTPQYIEMRDEAFRNDGLFPSSNTAASGQFVYAPDLTIWDTTRQTNWQKVLLGGKAQYTDASAGFSGGSAEIQYLVGANYHRETTVCPGNFSDQKGSMHFSLSNGNDIRHKFHFLISSNYLVDDNKLPSADLTPIALGLPPNAPELYNPDGSLNWLPNSNGVSTFINPLGRLFYQTYNSKTNNLIANGNFGYDILPGLKISTALGFTNLQSNDIQANSLLAQRPERRNTTIRTVTFGDSKLNTWSIEPQLSYKKIMNKGAFDGLLGTSFQRTVKEAQYLTGTGYTNDQLMTNPSAAASIGFNGYLKSLYKYNAVFSRLNYIYNDKYILNVTGRRDGSTRFGANNKFHNFWSVGAGWIFSQESFFLKSKSFFSFGKLKGSYGTTGSDQIGDYRFLTLYNNFNVSVPYQGISSLTTGDIPNPYLQWEETKKLNLGIDLGFLNNRIFVTANYSRNKSSNQLIDYFLPRITGRTTVLTNFPATIQNTNWELTLNTENIKNKNFTWTTNINLTIPKNKLVDFPGLESSSYSTTYIIGQPTNLMKLYQNIGVDPTSGLYTYADSHGNTTTSPNSSTDRTAFFSDNPKFYGGFQNSIQYGKFQLDVLFQFVKKMSASTDFGLVLNPGTFFQSATSFAGNQPASVMKRWQKPGEITDIEKFAATTSSSAYTAFINANNSNKRYVDGSYIRFKNLSLSWGLPSNWIQRIHLLDCRLFAQAQNLLTITNYKGLDPEVPGYSTLPPLRVVTFGLQLKL